MARVAERRERASGLCHVCVVELGWKEPGEVSEHLVFAAANHGQGVTVPSQRGISAARTPMKRARARTIVPVVLFCAWPALLCAQSRDLHADLSKLNIRRETRHYAIAGTVSDRRMEKFATALEFIHRAYAEGFEGLLNPRSGEAFFGSEGTEKDAGKEPERFHVVVLATNEQYGEFGKAYFGTHAEHTRGLYVDSARLLLVSAAGTDEETYEVLFHEAFHQFLHRYVPAAPTWLHEGLATYYGTARPTKSGLVFDRHRWDYRSAVLEAANAGMLIALDQLVMLDGESFYRAEAVEGLGFSRRRLAYAQAYTLCRYLLSDKAARRHLRDYIRALAQAGSAADVKRITSESWSANLLRALSPQWLDSVRRWR